jgi:hypothetical protein
VIDPRKSPVIIRGIAHGIEAEAKEVEIETATTTRAQEVEGEQVQDHLHQDKVTASGIPLTEVLAGGGNYQGHHLLPARGHHGGKAAELHANDTYPLLEMIVIIVTVLVTANQIGGDETIKVEAMGLVAIRRQILYLQKC